MRVDVYITAAMAAAMTPTAMQAPAMGLPAAPATSATLTGVAGAGLTSRVSIPKVWPHLSIAIRMASIVEDTRDQLLVVAILKGWIYAAKGG